MSTSFSCQASIETPTPGLKKFIANIAIKTAKTWFQQNIKDVDFQIVPALFEEARFEIPLTIEKNTRGTKIIFKAVIKIWPTKIDISEIY